jgi:hypothetical protein
MPAKKAANGQRYTINGRTFTWHPDAEEGEALADVVLPMRIKLKVIRELADMPLTADTMADILELVAPEHEETYAEMDLNDFQSMFNTWQAEYEKLSGASLGESSGSPS